MEYLFLFIIFVTAIPIALVAYDIGKTVERRDNIRKQRQAELENTNTKRINYGKSD